jgi:hypothetical protein
MIKNIIYYDINSKCTKTATHKRLDEFHYGNPPESRPHMAQHLIDLVADNPAKKQDYGRPIPLHKFADLHKEPAQPAAAAATLKSIGKAAFNNDSPAQIHTIYEPATGYHDGNINKIEMSMESRLVSRRVANVAMPFVANLTNFIFS